MGRRRPRLTHQHEIEAGAKRTPGVTCVLGTSMKAAFDVRIYHSLSLVQFAGFNVDLTLNRLELSTSLDVDSAYAHHSSAVVISTSAV
jgi:hypothetical protein